MYTYYRYIVRVCRKQFTRSFVSVQIVVNKGKTIYYSFDLCNKKDFLSVSPGV